MIRIKKSPSPPPRLKKKGKPETENNKKLYDADPGAFQSGKKTFEFHNNIYGHSSVKKQLIREQHGKCCFCEAKILSNSYGDVEHFRPKGGYQTKKSEKMKRPGYYWEAYDWDNLFFSCQVCNSRHKKNFFPLEDEAERVSDHHGDLAEEAPLLVHPSQDNPEAHIGFRENVCYPLDRKGKTSISAYGLNRELIVEKRREYLENLEKSITIASIDYETLEPEKKEWLLSILHVDVPGLLDLISRARRFIEQAVEDSVEFAAMVHHRLNDEIDGWISDVKKK